MPKVIYCLHALSSHLFKIGKAPLIHDVFGKAVFTGNYIIIILFKYTILALLPYKLSLDPLSTKGSSNSIDF